MLKATSGVAMSGEYMQHFIQSTKAVFQTLMGWEIKVVGRNQGTEFTSGHDLSGIIGFAGAVRGTIVLSVDQEVGFATTKAFTGDSHDTINNDVRDMIAEISNMIAGRAKEYIDLDEISLGLPTCVSGKDHVISFNPIAEVESARFRSPCGNIAIQIAMQR
jgi:chemotaxis protein CheX